MKELLLGLRDPDHIEAFQILLKDWEEEKGNYLLKVEMLVDSVEEVVELDIHSVVQIVLVGKAVFLYIDFDMMPDCIH